MSKFTTFTTATLSFYLSLISFILVVIFNRDFEQKETYLNKRIREIAEGEENMTMIISSDALSLNITLSSNYVSFRSGTSNPIFLETGLILSRPQYLFKSLMNSETLLFTLRDNELEHSEFELPEGFKITGMFLNSYLNDVGAATEVSGGIDVRIEHNDKLYNAYFSLFNDEVVISGSTTGGESGKISYEITNQIKSIVKIVKLGLQERIAEELALLQEINEFRKEIN